MALKSAWDGFLRLNLISIPVRAYTTGVTGRGRIGFHQIHKTCNSRINYKKVCPIHGEVTKEEIVSGYEIAKGEYVLLNPAELKKLKAENDKTISIDTFVSAEAIDPVYYTERSYYLTPDGKVGQKPYAVLQQVMADQQKQAIAQMVFSGRQQVVLIRPMGRLLAMTLLSYSDEVKKPGPFEEEIQDVAVAPKERELAESLLEASTAGKFDFAQYEDSYSTRVRELLEAKAAGKRVQAPKLREEPHVINLMDALRKSLGEAQKEHKPAKGRSASRQQHKAKDRAASPRRKTG